MKLSTKLVVSFLVVILLVAGIGLISSYINESVKDQLLIENRKAIEEVKLTGEMALELYRSLTKAQYLLEEPYRKTKSLADLDASQVPAVMVRQQIEEAVRNFRANIENSKSLIKEDHKTMLQDSIETANVINLLDKLEKKFDIYVSLIGQFQTLNSHNYSDGKEFFSVTIEPFFRTALLPLIEQVRSGIQINLQRNIASLNTRLERLSYLFILATVFALVISLLLAFYLYRSITEPLHKISNAAQNIGHGNLDDRIDYNRNNELGKLSATFNDMAESLGRTTVSRDYMDSIIESMADLLIVTNQQFEITRINSAGLLMLEKTRAEVLGKEVKTFFGDTSELVLHREEKSGTDGKIQNFSTVLSTGAAKPIPVSVSKGILKGHNAQTEGYVIVASDISAQKQAQSKIEQSLQEKELLLAEIHHRVKNNLAVISGLLQMQIWDVANDSVVKALQESQLRVSSIGLVHEKIYQSNNLSSVEFDNYLDDLLQTIADIYRSDQANIVLVTAFKPVTLDISQAIPCALLLNELVINAFEHAFNGQENGIIKVSMEKRGNQIIFQVKDNGNGLTDETAHAESLGMTLVNTLSKQLEGEIDFQNNRGLEVTVVFNTKESEDTNNKQTAAREA